MYKFDEEKKIVNDCIITDNIQYFYKILVKDCSSEQEKLLVKRLSILKDGKKKKTDFYYNYLIGTIKL